MMIGEVKMSVFKNFGTKEESTKVKIIRFDLRINRSAKISQSWGR